MNSIYILPVHVQLQTVRVFITKMSPLEQFEVQNLISLEIPIMGLNISLTNLGFYTLITIFILTTLHIIGFAKYQTITSNRFSLFMESIYATINTIVREQIGSRNEVYLPFLYALFTFILAMNLVGNIPYTFTVATRVTVLSVDTHRLHFMSYFVPAGTPIILVPVLVLIELISYIARAVSLGVRHCLILILGGFMYSGLTSGAVIFIATLVPMALFLLIVGLEIAVSFIQAYVFTILVCIYIKDSIHLH
ncbi:ATP synthase A chain-domain-containing protein [Phakopsora pachyrhizi]|nr:ATP synthase A chain-domain-containing protein [Phakopsora pachyrhizi]